MSINKMAKSIVRNSDLAPGRKAAFKVAKVLLKRAKRCAVINKLKFKSEL